jgi:hypothetical protein
MARYPPKSRIGKLRLFPLPLSRRGLPEYIS